MGKAVFISFDHGDAQQVGGLRATLTNSNSKLSFVDRSLPAPVLNAQGHPIKLLPDNPSAEKLRVEIRALMERASRMLVLLGRDTHSSEWVKWEIGEFYKRKRLGANTQQILCMRLKGSANTGAPQIVKDYGLTVVNWDTGYLARWAGSSTV